MGLFLLLCLFGYIALLRSNAKHKAFCEQSDRLRAIEHEKYQQAIAEIDKNLKQIEEDFSWLNDPLIVSSK